ncbi:hypothetical protein J3R83DRAFT_10617 [Lanmaoa asiatica]|nr:hypothetical protein J3R83DRAFT_10617 [Lanmaoa asiatica]
MSYVIFGRSIKNEYLTLGTLFTVGAAVFALRGGKTDAVAAGKPLTERVKDAVPIKAESRINSIKNFIAEAEKESGGILSFLPVNYLAVSSLVSNCDDHHRNDQHSEISSRVHSLKTTFMTSLPSPPTSPTSPRAATTTRIRIKHPRRPGSLSNVSYTPGSEGHGERTRSMSPSLSRIVTADPDTPGPENRTTSASAVARKRRQTSITYYTPSSPSPWSQRPQSNRTLSSGVDGPRDGEPVMANGTGNVSQRSSLVLGSRTPSTRESLCSSDGVGAREPLTLVEKHADLLHFIAQKERKCLELRDQLAAHEKDLAELKRKWERIVNRGHDPFPNPLPTAGLGGTALDGLKEGVRMIAAGFSDLGGVIQEFDSGDKGTSKPMSLTHAARENNTASNARRNRPDGEHFSTSSMSSIQESMHTSDRALEGGDGETVTTTVATAPSLSRTGSLNYRMHKRASRVIAKEPTTPTSACGHVAHTDTQSHVGAAASGEYGAYIVRASAQIPSARADTRVSAHDRGTKVVLGGQYGQETDRTAKGPNVLHEPETRVVALGRRLQHDHFGPLTRANCYNTRTGPNVNFDFINVNDATHPILDETALDVSRIDQVIPDHAIVFVPAPVPVTTVSVL